MNIATCLRVGLLFCMAVPALADADEQHVADEQTFNKVVQPFLREYCITCHGKKDYEGDIQITRLSFNLAASKSLDQWQLVLKQLKLEEMPPYDEPQPSDQASTTAQIPLKISQPPSRCLL